MAAVSGAPCSGPLPLRHAREDLLNLASGLFQSTGSLRFSTAFISGSLDLFTQALDNARQLYPKVFVEVLSASSPRRGVQRRGREGRAQVLAHPPRRSIDDLRLRYHPRAIFPASDT